MLKRTIGLSLLCVAGHAYSANINLIVTTTADENGTNSSACSLREAIALINSGQLNVVSESTTLPKVVSNGYGGCGVLKTAQITTTDDKGVSTTKLGVATDSDTYSSIIELENGKVYDLTLPAGRLQIKKAMTIRAKTLDDVNDAQGTKNPIIRAGKTGIFQVNDEETDSTKVITFSLEQVNLEGCNITGTQTAVCATQGGVIINNEILTLNKLRIKGGWAELGGAIYNASADARLSTSNVEFSDNKALTGAAIYVEKSGLNINRSLFQKNTATDTANFGAVIWMATQGKVLDSTSFSRTDSIISSTFTNNTAYASNLVQDMVISSSTIVGNSGGVYLNSVGLANLANSIVADNGTADCTFSATDQSYLNNTLYMNHCDQTPIAGHLFNSKKISNTGDETLIADANHDLVCDKPPMVGLLCPLRAGVDDFNAYLKPRLLADYTSILQSPIVNQGRNISSTPQELVCTLTDQRGKARTLCDLGAIELVINGDLQTNGKDILYGEKALLDLTDIIGDGELMPADRCAALYPNLAIPNGGWQNGCLQYTQAPLKGVQIFVDDHTVQYTPSSNYHGNDVFQYSVTTTTSRFSDALNDQTINIKTTIVQDPPNDFENKKVNLSGGSTSIFGLFGLMGLAWMRRRVNGVRPQ
jgi:rhombotarget A family protien